MKTTHLQHHPCLGYARPADLRMLAADLVMPHPCSNFVSLRKHPHRAPDAVIKKLHAARRPLELYGDGSYCFYGLQDDSPLAPLLLWDAAHFLSVGEKITVMEDWPVECYLDREYFADSLKVVTRTPMSVTYEKVSRLAAESSEDDLDSWTFGIPVGPGDASVLNAVVKRILEIEIPNKEILLCGTPGSNFSYFDKVRIVGEDITAPPVQICKKKNRLAQEARYSNMVILHDRVFLPRHFAEMVRRFGPNYPLMTLQSMFFDNRLSMHPRRYSDYGMAMSEIAQGLQGVHRSAGEAVTIAPSVFSEIERTGFCFANPMRYNQNKNYPTGSLYICRREVWNAYPLDESLYWVEFEDIEHGMRTSRAGVPNRVNPFGISQSITSRALLGVKSPLESADGRYVATGPRYFSMFRKKPLIAMPTEAALMKLRQFVQKYVPHSSAINIPSGQRVLSARAWVALINDVIQQAAFRNDIDSVREFLCDFERLVLLDQLPYTGKEVLTKHFLDLPVQAKQMLITQSSEIRNMLLQRPRQTWFASDTTDFFHPRFRSLPGIVISAMSAYSDRHKHFHFESFGAAVRAIYNSTPFMSYTKVSR